MANEDDIQTTVNSQPDDQNGTGLRVDTGAYAPVAFYGPFVPPIGMDFARAAAIEADAEMARNLDGAENFLNIATLTATGTLSLEERRRRAEQGADEFSQTMIAATARERQLQLERDEWARTEHSFAGVELTGEDWSHLGQTLKREGPLRSWLVVQMERDGKTRDQAERKADEMADVYDALGKPPNQRSQAERDVIARAEHDPDYQRYTTRLAQMRSEPAAAPIPAQIERSDRRASVENGADLFNSAPDLTASHRLALAATVPLDAPPIKVPKTPTPAPPVAAAGLDV